MINLDLKRFMKALRNHLKKAYSDEYFIGTIYEGDQTITYFPFTPNELKKKKLKIAIVFQL